MNSITLVGRAGKDPEVRYFESGSAVASLTVADRGYKKDETTWFNVEIWGKAAQVAADYVRKGSMIAVEGVMKTETWIDKKNGEQRSKMVLNANRLELLGGEVLGGKQNHDMAPQVKYQATTKGRPPVPALTEEELPF